MTDDISRYSKILDSIFLLDESKLRRLLNVIVTKFGDERAPKERFQTTLKSGKDIAVSSIDHLIGQDNAVSNPMSELEVSVTGQLEGQTEEASVTFHRDKSKINIRVTSRRVKWAAELFGEIEEQVERTLVKNWVYSVKKGGAGFVFASVFLAFAVVVTLFKTTPEGPTEVEARRLLLETDVVERLADLARSAESMEERVDLLFKFHEAQIDALKKTPARRPRPIESISLDLPALFVALPLVVILCAGWYLLARCYPGSVFVWGDFADHYRTLLDRRRFFWNAIVVALLIGLISNLAVYGFDQFRK